MSPARPRTLRRLWPSGPSWDRRLWNAANLAACWIASAIVILPLALIVWHLLAKGLPALNLAFFLHMPKPVGESGGGMANAIVGTLVLVGLGAVIAVPVGVGAGVWLSEYGHGRFAALVRYTADVLAGVPSIVVGVAAYGLVVVPMGRFSALAGGVALGILMLPTIVRSTEEVVRLVPRSYREASLALGAPQLAHHPGGGDPFGLGRHRDRHHAGDRARCGRDRTAALHRARQPLLVAAARPAHGLAAGLHLRLRACALRGLEPPGLDRGARIAHAGDAALGGPAHHAQTPAGEELR